MWAYCRNHVFRSDDSWKLQEQRFHGRLLEQSGGERKGSQSPRWCRLAELPGACSEVVLYQYVQPCDDCPIVSLSSVTSDQC